MRQSLAVALPLRQLIVNADDLGVCAARDAGILAAFAAGAVTSASLLVNAPRAAEAARQALAAGLPLGLHLNLSEGRPCANGGTLAGSDGDFLGRHGLRAALAAGAVAHGDLAREIRAQFDAFIALTGELPGHVDGHQHCHVEAPVCAVLATIMNEEYGVRRVRLPHEYGIEAAAASGRLDADGDLDLPFQLAVANSAERARTVFAAAGIRSTDAFLGQTLMGHRLQAAAIAERLAALAATATTTATAGAQRISVELMVHPGIPAAAGEGSAFCRAPARGHELALLQSDAWRAATAGWQPLAWPDLCRADDANPRPRVLILGKLTPATGNAETARRHAEAWAAQADVLRRPLLADPADDATLAREAAHLRRHAAAEGLDLAVGIHLYRAGSPLAAAFADAAAPLPFGLLASGTDVNADLAQPARRDAIARNLAAADFLCCVSADLQQRLAASGLALPADSSVIGNGIAQAVVADPQRLAAIRRELGLPATAGADERLLILPASLRRLKGVLPLIDALAPMLATRFPGHRLLILGPTIEADYAAALTARIAELAAAHPALAGRIVLHPGLAHADYLALLPQAALLLNASDHEGLCHGIGEAMACGVPVLARDIAGNRELVRDGENGRLFADFAALPAACASVFADPATTARLAAAARRDIAARFPAAGERNALAALLARALARRQTVLPFADGELRLDRAADTHPLSAENRQLLAALTLSPTARASWPQTLPLVADIGCGCGVFAFGLLAAIAAGGRRVGRLLFTDPHTASLAALRRTLIRHRPQLAMLDNAELDSGSLLAPLLDRGERAQAIAFNLPQTPGPDGFRLDRSGGADGAELICRLLADLPQALADDGEAYLLHIGLAHPARVARSIAGIGFVAEVLAEQERHASFADYEALQPGLADHLRAEQATGRAEFVPDADGSGFCFRARLLRLRRAGQ